VPEPDLISLFVQPLESVGLSKYMVSGSVASIQFGEPRATLDVDLAVALDAPEVPRLVAAYPAEHYYVPPEDVIVVELNRVTRGHFNVIHLDSGMKADFYPSRAHPLFGWAIRNRWRIDVGGLSAWFAPPEYVILWKLEFFREGGGDKHLRDVRGILRGSAVDLDLLKDWSSRLRLDDEWKAASL
jgi:hypothetical protein